MEAVSRTSVLEVRLDPLELTLSSSNRPIGELESPLASKTSGSNGAVGKLESTSQPSSFFHLSRMQAVSCKGQVQSQRPQPHKMEAVIVAAEVA